MVEGKRGSERKDGGGVEEMDRFLRSKSFPNRKG